MPVASLRHLGERLRRPLRRVRARGERLRGLGFLWLEITRSCNLRCHHCYAGSSPELPLHEGMRFEDWCRVIDEAAASGCRQLQFIGGEPTMHPDLGRLIEHAARRGLRCEVFTNATLLRDELLRAFKDHGVTVAFSFYTTVAADHDLITDQRGSYERTVAGLRKLQAWKIASRGGIIVTGLTAPRLEETKAFLRRLGVASVGVDRVRGIGRGEQLLPDARPASELCGQCWNRKLCVTATGDTYPCVFSRFARVGNVARQSLGTILAGDELREFRRRVYVGEQGG